MIMNGTLLDVFEIAGRGCVVLVDVHAGDCSVGDKLTFGEKEFEVIGIDVPRYSPETVRRMEEGWKPPLGLLLRNAFKSDLLAWIGRTVSGVET